MSGTLTSPVLFCIAAGPRVGFGHLARSRALARVLGVPFVVALRGTAATRRAAKMLGARLVPAGPRTLARLRPGLVVVDDPKQSAAAASVRHARRAGVPVASVHDLGRAYVASDLVIDGSLLPRTGDGAPALGGPAFAIFDPQVARAGREPREAGRVLIALGGGAHVRQSAAALVGAIAHRVPGVVIDVAAGFSSGRRPELPAPGQWLEAPDGLAVALARCAVAVLAGGVTVYEACVTGTPVVALAVVPSQRRTVRALSARGAAIDAGLATSAGAPARVAAAVAAIVADPAQGRLLGKRARVIVDGRGVFRVATRLALLARPTQETSHAA